MTPFAEDWIVHYVDFIPAPFIYLGLFYVNNLDIATAMVGTM